MKIVSTIAKILAAIAAIAGVAYILAAYGDKIVAAAKKLLGLTPKESFTEVDNTVEEASEEATEEVVEEVSTVETTEEAEAPVAASEGTPSEIVADETDFEA